jgi:hypothetical protein
MRCGNHEDWFRATMLIAVPGMIMIGVGRAVKWSGVTLLGEILVMPLLLLAALAVVVGVPYGVWVRHNERRKN